MAFILWAIASVLISNVSGVRQHGMDTEETLHVTQGDPDVDRDLVDGAASGDLRKVQLALVMRARVNSVNQFGETALASAAAGGHLKVVEKLLSSGANKEEKSGWYRQTALSKAAEKGHLEVVQMLLDHGALVDSENQDGWTPLLYAARYGHAKVVKLLLDKNADAKHQTKDERNALHLATFDGHAEIIKMFLDKDVPVNVIDSWGDSPLLNAANTNDEAVKLLLDAGADVNVKKNPQMKTPLHNAAQYGRVEMVKMLLAKGADVNARDSEGETPLDMCKKHFIQPKFGPQSLQKGDPKEVEKLLIEAGGHEKGSWGLMGERVKDTFGW